MKPDLRCVLQHWVDLKPDAERDQNASIALMDDVANKYSAVRMMHEVAQRRGLAGLKTDILLSLRGEQPEAVVHLPVGAGLFSDELRIETYVRKCLKHNDLRFQVAATYASTFYMNRSEEISCILSERVVLADGWPLVVAASKDALGILADVRLAGRCLRCGPTDTQPLTSKQPDWVRRRGLSKSPS